MKVFIVTSTPYPTGRSATSRVKCYARAIWEGGLDCEVDIFQRTELPEKVKNSKANGVDCGIPYRYIGGTSIRHRIKYLRPLLDIIDKCRMGWYLNQNMSKGDVLFLYMGGKVEWMLHFMRVAHKRGAFCVRDLCELPRGTGIETETAIRLRKNIIKRQFPLLDGIISISDTLLNLARTYTLPQCKHLKIPILVDYNQYVLPDRSSEADVPFIFHAGTLSEQKDGILGMIEAFGMVVPKLDKPVRFILTGHVKDSRHESEIRNLIEQYHLEDMVKFTGFISEDELKDYLSKSSLVIINKYPTRQNNYCFSTKLGEYLAAAKPVIMTNVGEAMNWLKNGVSAYIIEPYDVDTLSDAIENILTNPEKARGIGLAGRGVCQRSFDYRNWSKPLVDFLNQLGK